MEMKRESIMVCVHYGPHGQRLIQRGSRLAELLHAPLIVLTVDALGDNEYNREKQQYLSGWETLTKAAGGEFVIRNSNGKKTSEVISKTAQERGITQIVIGQSGQTLWQEITKGNFINELLERIGPVDLHIVAVQRYPELLEQTHEQGITAYLLRRKDRYVLSDEASGDEAMKGIFFRELHTDFNTGLFKIVTNGEAQYLRVVQNEWVKPQ
ncbi:universal stress protein [Paenibacillus sp. MMS20-IR301]|uniref:universal stress protein n=1 Tax=Paenibacillus sp. MMS20-IR301 TaxID=2895946 RepID=UPI0028F0FE5F|nr:universal stress protein [Paenibacillus sp. MMS20-IR301]WNS44143.1 universal stress protein [Paenibacillus sp. MMS20-IR301]